MGGRLASPVFIGRREALAAASKAIDGTLDGRSSHLLVAGEAGIGKSRFGVAVADLARARGFVVVRGGCVRLGSGELPYAPMGEAIGEIARELSPDAFAAAIGGEGTILARVTGALGSRDPDAIEARSPEAGRGTMLVALLGLFRRLAAQAPVLFVVEDLQWADSASLDALAYLLRTLEGERVSLLLTFRSDELHRRHPLRPWLGEVERLDVVGRLDLGPLDTAETGELIAAILGTDPDPDQVARIQERADGNPLYIEELLARDETRDVGSGLSPALRDILLARISSVPPQAQTLLGVAAVAGRRTDGDLLARVCGVSPRALDAALRACIDRGLLVIEHHGDDERLAFRHELIREAAEDVLLPRERVRLHRACAESLAVATQVRNHPDPGRWAEIAHHWDAAHDEPRVFEAALRAAAEAEHAYAFDAALGQWRRALAAWDLVPDPAAIAGFDRAELLRRAADAAKLAGHKGHIPLIYEAIAEADRLGDPARGGALRGRLGLELWIDGRPAEAHSAFAEALALLPTTPPTAERGWTLCHLAAAQMMSGAFRGSVHHADAALIIAQATGDRRMEGHALNTRAGSLVMMGQCGRAVECLEQSLVIALEVGDPYLIGRAYVNGTEVLRLAGDDHEALRLAHEGVERVVAMGLGDTIAPLLRLQAAVVAFDLGRWSEAADLEQQASMQLSDRDTKARTLDNTGEAAVCTAHLDIARGAWDMASRKLATTRQLIVRFEADEEYTGPWACAMAELALWQRRPHDALAEIEAGLTRVEATDDIYWRMRLLRLGLCAAADLAETARHRRDVAAEARMTGIVGALRARTASAVDAIAGTDGGLAIELAAEETTASAEETRLHGRSDPSAWRAAAAGWEARERPYPRAYARWREAEACLSQGDRAAAADALGEAASIVGQLGPGPLMDAVSALARRARIPLSSAPGDAGERQERPDRAAAVAAEFGLTPREREVLELVSLGMTNAQIAANLFISVHTAGVHVSRILGKLGVASRTEAASMAYRLGMTAR